MDEDSWGSNRSKVRMIQQACRRRHQAPSKQQRCIQQTLRSHSEASVITGETLRRQPGGSHLSDVLRLSPGFWQQGLHDILTKKVDLELEFTEYENNITNVS